MGGPKANPWGIVSAIGSVVTAGALIAIVTISVDMKRQQKLMSDAFDRSQATNWIDEKHTVNNCHADNEGVTCTITNVLSSPITTCLEGSIRQKKATGLALKSLLMCTGRLAPRETRTMSVPWLGGFAKDLCNKENQFGQILDFSECTFDTAGIDLPAIEARTAASASP